ncbi:MAG: NYN domain-containing protein [Candidatus Omnitrophota bacterium]
MSLHFLIDGYNIIKQDECLREIRSLKEARLALLKIIQDHHFFRSPNNQVTLVFDGRDEFNLYSVQSKGPINIVFSSNGKSADEAIKKITQESKHPRQIVVITNDKAIIFFVRSLGAVTMGVTDFLKKHPRKAALDKQKAAGLLKAGLTYQQQEAINQELRRLWE